jgi:KaiC/GvpD/RAD55 family RecA-like ATPase
VDVNGAKAAGLLPQDPFGSAPPMDPSGRVTPMPAPEANVNAERARLRLQGAVERLCFTDAHEAVRDLARAHNTSADECSACPATPTSVIDAWRQQGPVERVTCGVAPIDSACRGGIQFPRRIMIAGAPGAAKTGLTVALLDHFEREGCCVAVLAVDEDADDVMMRFAQMAGFDRDRVEARDDSTVSELTTAFADRRVRFYAGSHTIEAAVANASGWAKAEHRRLVFAFDSLQTVRAEAAMKAETPRQIVEANVAAIRKLTDEHRFVAIMTSEANRASYRNRDAGETTNDLAAGAESRAIEYGAQLLLMLRTPKDHGDIVHARIAKNRGADKGEFWLRLNRDRHTFTPCEEPGLAPEEQAERAERDRQGNRRRVEADARIIATFVGREPGMGESELRAAVKAGGHKWGRDRVEAAKRRLAEGLDGLVLVDRRRADAGRTAPRKWWVEPLGNGGQDGDD